MNEKFSDNISLLFLVATIPPAPSAFSSRPQSPPPLRPLSLPSIFYFISSSNSAFSGFDDFAPLRFDWQCSKAIHHLSKDASGCPFSRRVIFGNVLIYTGLQVQAIGSCAEPCNVRTDAKQSNIWVAPWPLVSGYMSQIW